MKKVFIILFLFNILLYSKTLDESLFSAVENNNIKKVKSYLEQGANCNALDSYNRTALINASVSGYDDIAKLLIEEGTDVNIQDKAGATALMYTARNTNYEMVEFLLKNGADVNFYKGGSTALISACEYSHERNIDVIKYLVSKNANINAQDNEGDTALNKTLDTLDEGSIDILDFEIANFLIEQGADVNIKNKREYTPLIYLGMGEGNFNNKSFQEYRIKLAEVLLEKGADINAKDYNGYTSLIWACSSYGSRFAEPYVKFLVEKGADINIENDYGDTALDIAEHLKLRKIVSILKKAQRTQRK
ncbi:ankyrin repeat domain-containing protein [Brachyspira pilosicoli]|uniref:Ankyrin repeat domain-containing protein n=1 Tax=Brachyspira pilosicoli TaxID=52584 RepID=A0A5C8EW88_BRAPL|nr:ankyrin repeat domain-containing protein [Brachyspira pilosicoli]TXJ42165.1 ankyrin repeat domain-containing protein [Brachyspira pilosicoli]